MPLWKDRILDLLLPRVCLDCLEDLPPPASGPLCGDCLRALKPLAGPFCRRCAGPSGGADRCRGCRGRAFALECVRAAFPYRRPVRALVHAFKYRGRLSAGRALAGWMAGAYPRSPELRGADALVPVPLHPARMRERGFNQAALLAEEVGRSAGLPLVEALERPRNTRPQWLLGRRERERNLRGAFQAAAGAAVEGRSILLVDDVCTTGGTLEGCASALKSAGARRVRAFVLARD